MNTFLVQSLGCKVSQYDGNRLEERLSELGWTSVQPGAAPDLFVLNGCAVTARASQKVRQALRAAKRRWPKAKVVLTGCEAKRRDLHDDVTVEADGVLPLMVPIDELRRRLVEFGFPEVPSLETPFPTTPDIAHLDNREGHSDGILTSGDDHGSSTPEAGGERVRAFLKIQDGCTQFCTYCIVPHLRGPETFRPIDDCVAEAHRLVSSGHREIVITGIHVGRYGPGLVTLLHRLEAVSGLDRIRVSSIEPLEVGEDLIEWLATSPVSCQHLHIPLQAGEDGILAAMNRPYRTAEFAVLVARLRARLPRIALTTDLIVGFPGETEPQFENGLAFVETMAFSRLHIFRYSIRPGTPAATYLGQIAGPEKQRRARAAEAVWHRSAEAFHRSFIGKTVEVLWETCQDGFFQGTSREYLVCRRPAQTGHADDLINQIECARVIAADAVTVEVE